MNRVKSASNHTLHSTSHSTIHFTFYSFQSILHQSILCSLLYSILFEILNPQAFIPNSISTFHATFLYAIFGTLCVLPFILHSIPYFMLHVIPYIPHSCYSTLTILHVHVLSFLHSVLQNLSRFLATFYSRFHTAHAVPSILYSVLHFIF